MGDEAGHGYSNPLPYDVPTNEEVWESRRQADRRFTARYWKVAGIVAVVAAGVSLISGNRTAVLTGAVTVLFFAGLVYLPIALFRRSARGAKKAGDVAMYYADNWTNRPRR